MQNLGDKKRESEMYVVLYLNNLKFKTNKDQSLN